MVEVRNNNIWLTRGDTMKLDIELYDGDSPYVPATGDSIRFAVKPAKMDLGKTAYVATSPVINVSIDTSTMELSLSHADTASLPFGNYVYDIELSKTDGTVDTFIAEKSFVLMPEVH